MKNLALYPYKMGSNSASELSKALGVAQIKHTRSKFLGGPRKAVINWGAYELPEQVRRCRVINNLTAVRCARNKLDFFNRLSQTDVRLVPWTIDPKMAKSWLDEKSVVVARTTLTGHSGHGIMIVSPSQKLPTAPLYTKYIPKDSEWRVHVMAGEVIDVQRKVRNPDQEPKDWKVRSHDNGFIFIRNTESAPPDVPKQALGAFKGSGLDFGAFDIIFNKKQNKAYVLEANTAPGLEGQTIEVYANAFRKLATA